MDHHGLFQLEIQLDLWCHPTRRGSHGSSRIKGPGDEDQGDGKRWKIREKTHGNILGSQFVAGILRATFFSAGGVNFIHFLGDKNQASSTFGDDRG